jgi:hypothetical protein
MKICCYVKNLILAVIANPPVLPPVRLFPPSDIDQIPLPDHLNCETGDCFDFSRCPITGGFPIYIYDLEIELKEQSGPYQSAVKITEYLSEHSEVVTDPTKGKFIKIRFLFTTGECGV